jgi:hypothetical protein
VDDDELTRFKPNQETPRGGLESNSRISMCNISSSKSCINL